ncbi:Hypothetical protein FKW44_000260 [Caligus rogercresseyi]|uniref:Uncharacterized protein n=1 Tax=Caligus rogercresseyi TaxID=217165 RepID=A0A7T8KH27_CALRO|nr:Hypothetical protein FKW44_000260 [Caligus rogercresseyi]
MWRNAVECIIEVTGASIQQVVAQSSPRWMGTLCTGPRMSCQTSKRHFGASTRRSNQHDRRLPG